jgi:hypothetical protein
MGLKFAHAFGAHTVLFTTSPSKSADAKRMGADEIVISKNEAEMQKHVNSFDFILDTVSADHDLNVYLNLLKRDGTMTLVGAPPKPPAVQIFGLLMKRCQLAGSGIGRIRETQEMLDFCAEHGITSDIELIPIQQINEAYERLLKSDVNYRFVIELRISSSYGKTVAPGKIIPSAELALRRRGRRVPPGASKRLPPRLTAQTQKRSRAMRPAFLDRRNNCLPRAQRRARTPRRPRYQQQPSPGLR